MGARRARRRFARDDPDGQAPRRFLPLADERRRRHSCRDRARGAAGTATSFASSSTRAAPRASSRGSTSRRGIATIRSYGDSPRYNDSVLRSAHRAADALRTDRRSLVRRRERRRPERQEAGLRLAARVGARAAASAERHHVFRRGPGRPLVRQREAASRAIRTGRPSIPASSRSRGPTVPASSTALQHGDPARHRLASGGSRRLDPPRMVPPPERGRAGSLGGRSDRISTSRPSAGTASCCSTCRQRARTAARHRCHPAYEVQGRAGGDLPGRCGRGPSGRLARHGREDGDGGDSSWRAPSKSPSSASKRTSRAARRSRNTSSRRQTVESGGSSHAEPQSATPGCIGSSQPSPAASG